MTLGTRRIIYLSFITIFLLIGAILMVYANGYRGNIKKWEIDKVGVLFLTSKQSNISLYLDDKLQTEKIQNGNLSLRNILPGEYLVRAEKENHLPWQKKLVISSGRTTFTEDIVLFQKSLPTRLASGAISQFNLSSDRQKIVYSIAKEDATDVLLIDLKTKKSSLLYQSQKNDTLEINDWSPSGEKIIINIKKGGKNNYLVLNTTNPDEVLFLSGFKKAGAEGDTHEKFIGWGFNEVGWQNKNNLYGLIANQLYEINLEKKEVSPIAELKIGSNDKINDYLIDGQDIYYLKTDELNSYIVKIDNQTIFQIKLEKSPNYEFIPNNEKFLIILDKQREVLQIITKTNFENIALEAANKKLIINLSAKGAFWRPNSDELLYYNDYEIIIFNPRTNEKQIVGRYGEKIKTAAWHSTFQYIIVLLDNKILALEIYGRDKNIFDLAELPNADNFEINDLGTKLFIFSTTGEQEELSELIIQGE
jgi:hypothetical protein